MSKFCITYHIDNMHNIVYLSDEWQLFSNQNKAQNLTSETVLNKPLSDFITGRESVHIYEMLINRFNQGRAKICFPFRCDSPERRRFMEMEIFPVDGELIGFKSCVLREEPREPVRILDVDIERSEEFINICSWCKNIYIGESNWVEIEKAIEKLEILNSPLLPQLSHGVCPSCYENIRSKIID